LRKTQDIKKCQYAFILENYPLFLSINGKLEFLQLNRQGKNSEQRFRNQFKKELVMENGSGHFTIVFDSDNIYKGGNSTSEFR
jgi:hypothetical protein